MTDWDSLRAELLSLAQADATLRAELAADGSLFQGYHPRMQALHDANGARLSAILQIYGWPGYAQVGVEGAEAAWLIVQHAIAQPALQRRALGLIQTAVRASNADPLHAAMLEDRIRGLEGRPQLYGTQFDWDASNQLTPLPIEDPDGVDRRRAALGLPPLAIELANRRRAMATGPERPPADWGARQQEIEAWCREVGWRD
ncbi:MAG TPA: DUF6624 domain-containing protein [Gemmatimonadales bacterium]|nr:DUF6624 domain-containing protein [Gemmatimonadales bacterium]